MKKTKLLSLTGLMLSLGLASCQSTPAEPVKEEAKDPMEGKVYGADDNIHWLEDAKTHVIDKSTRADHEFEPFAGDSKHEPIAATCTEPGEKFERCKDCGFVRTVNIDMVEHKYVEDPTKAVEATCSKVGKKVEVCSACQAQNEIEVPKNGVHAFGGEATLVHAAEDGAKSKLSVKSCSNEGCTSGKDFIVDAISYTTISGALRDGITDNSMKLKSNNNSVTYKIDMDKAYEGCKVALFGYIDNYNDGNNNNQNKGYFVNGSATFSVTVNGTAVQIKNEQTFAQMGMVEGENHLGVAMLCYLDATADLVQGENTIVYKRLGSYNLNVFEIHFIAD